MACSLCALIRKRGLLRFLSGQWPKVIELAMSEEDLVALRAIARSRSEPASRVERARMLLAYRDEPSFFQVGRAVGAHHQTVQRCVERALVYGPMAALDVRPRSGKEPTITAEAKAWVSTSPAARPRISAIRTNCGRRDCLPAMRASMAPPKDTPASASWLRARCAKSSMSRRRSRTGSATALNAAICASIAK